MQLLVKRIRISLHSISPLNRDKLELFLSLDNLHALFKLGHGLVCQLPNAIRALKKSVYQLNKTVQFILEEVIS